MQAEGSKHADWYHAQRHAGTTPYNTGICKQRGDCKHEGNLTTIAVLRRRACASRRGNMTQRHSSTLHALDLSLRQNRGCGWLTDWLTGESTCKRGATSHKWETTRVGQLERKPGKEGWWNWWYKTKRKTSCAVAKWKPQVNIKQDNTLGWYVESTTETKRV